MSKKLDKLESLTASVDALQDVLVSKNGGELPESPYEWERQTQLEMIKSLKGAVDATLQIKEVLEKEKPRSQIMIDHLQAIFQNAKMFIAILKSEASHEDREEAEELLGPYFFY